MACIIFLMDFSEGYSRGILQGVFRYTVATRQAWNLCRLPLSVRDVYGIEGVVEWARKIKADAIVGQFYNDDPVELFAQNGIIAIAEDFKKRFTSIPNITGNHRMAGQMGAKYFIKKGFSNFAFYGIRDIVWSDERMEGFQQTVEAANPNFTFSSLTSDTQNILWYYNTEYLTEWLKSLPKPVAIMAADDNQANHIIEACQQIDNNCRIPYDIAILGVDNDETLCKLSVPNLSSLNQAVEQAGYDTAQLIDRLLTDPTAQPEDIMVTPTHIITRQSTDIYATTDPNITLVLRYIHDNITKKISVEEITRLVPLSRRLLEMKFRDEIGTSIHNYITQTRIEQMVQHLNDGKSISEAAAELGLFDIKNVSRIFKQIKGMTPSEYVEKIRHNVVKVK